MCAVRTRSAAPGVSSQLLAFDNLRSLTTGRAANDNVSAGLARTQPGVEFLLTLWRLAVSLGSIGIIAVAASFCFAD